MTEYMPTVKTCSRRSDELRIIAAETYDVIVQPSDDRAYTIFAERHRAIHPRDSPPRAGMSAEVPVRSRARSHHG